MECRNTPFKRTALTLVCWLMACTLQGADGMRHVGDYLLQAHFKLAGDKVIPIPMKPIAFHVHTDGVTVKVVAEGDDEAHTRFEIYRSDGISRQRTGGGAIEIIPGIQAISRVDGVLRHLRLSAESMTITTFPGVSNQTIVSHAVAAEATQKPSPKP
ncbi:MAG TPA: hypothetical protein VFY13_07590, partial [Luteolibacter sp.]|nr:hypothetical protein [Luteolibacter sp.]